MENLQPMIPSRVFTSRTATVMSAGRSDQFAGPLPGGNRPAFSYLLLGALRGWGDANGDGAITAEEGVEYAEGALSAMLTDRTQTPQIAGPSVDTKLSRGREEGPDIFAMVLDGSPTSAPTTTGADDFAAEMARLKQLQDEQKVLEAKRESAIEDAKRALLAQAAERWPLVQQMGADGGDAGVQAVETFIALYENATVEVGGETQAVEIALVEDAKKLLARARGGEPELVSASLGYRLMRVEAATFTMGAPKSEEGRDTRTYRSNAGRIITRENPHQVEVTAAFYLGATEISQGEWQAVMGTSPVFEREATRSGQSGPCNKIYDITMVGPKLPVACISWLEAVTFANALSQSDRLPPAYNIRGSAVRWVCDSEGYRLPTEAEWELAARAGTSQLFPGADGYTDLCDVANVSDLTAREAVSRWSSDGKEYMRCRDGYVVTAPVGSYTPNGFGLYDMAGNVWEWMFDQSGQPRDEDAIDPAGGASPYRVVKSGSFRRPAPWARPAWNSVQTPSEVARDVGFRLARGVTPACDNAPPP